MFRLAWVTDTHFNFLRIAGQLKSFVEYLKEDIVEVSGGELDALVFTGDIAEGSDFGDHIEDVKNFLGKPVYFILGNHDFYGSSFEDSENWAARLGGWLTMDGVVKLSDEVGLIGHEGWYDARFGNPYRLRMSDFMCIRDFNRRPVEGIIGLSRVRADHAAEAARAALNKALDAYSKVIFATHFPPFEGACWHEGKMSENDWIPWFTSKAMGDMLAEVAAARPDKHILVLCGHTHSPGYFKASDNLQVLTGQARYYHPDMAGILEIEEGSIGGYMKFGEKFMGLRTVIAP